MLSYAVRRSIELCKKDPKKLLKAFTPGGWQAFAGLAREGLRLARKAAMTQEQRAALARERRMKKFQSESWQHDGEFSQRRYASYDDYVKHQVSKLSRERVYANLTERYDERVADFRRHFELLTELPPHANVLCLAARLGHEVDAFISLGHFAIGIDLNPGQQNRYVVTGDFHHLVYADGSLDCVFTNSLDHAFDLPKIVAEVGRVLKPGGLFVAELFGGHEEGFVAGDFEAMHWKTAKSIADKIAALGQFDVIAARDLTPHGFANGVQYVMRKSAQPARLN
jgi:SAM-dependent methyltransferase